MKFSNTKLKLASLLVIIAFAITATAMERNKFIKEAESNTINQNTDLSEKANTDLGPMIFSVIRQYWNGIVNGHNNWKEDYTIGDWCMNEKFQAKIFRGAVIGIVRAFSFSYLNVFQLARDIQIAYDTITSQLIYCKGKQIGKAAHVFIYDTWFWHAVLSLVQLLLENAAFLVLSAKTTFFSLIQGDVKSIGHVHGKALNMWFNYAKEMSFDH